MTRHHTLAITAMAVVTMAAIAVTTVFGGLWYTLREEYRGRLAVEQNRVAQLTRANNTLKEVVEQKERRLANALEFRRVVEINGGRVVRESGVRYTLYLGGDK